MKPNSKSKVSEQRSDVEPENQSRPPPQEEPYDPFDPVNVRLDTTDFSSSLSEEIISEVTFGKPRYEHFFRVHPSPEYHVRGGLLDAERKTYLVNPAVARAFEGTNLVPIYSADLYLCITRSRALYLWGVKVPKKDGGTKWNESARNAIAEATKQWIRIQSGKDERYHIIPSQVGDQLGEPQWPKEPFKDLLRMAFEGKYIDKADHEVIRKLRGLQA
jgi:hypothetical protein